MAEINYLKERVAKAEENLKKAQNVVEKHRKSLEKKIKSNVAEWEIKVKEDEIKNAIKKIGYAEETLKDWQAKLNVEIEKERFLSENAPAVIIEFLNQWKQMAYDWHIKAYARYVEMKETLEADQYEAALEAARTLPEYERYRENGDVKEYYKRKYQLLSLHPYQPMLAYLKERKLNDRQISERLSTFGGAILRMATFYKEEERLAWLEKELERERKYKLYDLINRVNEAVGSITNASGLRINEKGNLDGIIEGEKGKAKVETIGAGGYNIQCFHYRTLVHKIEA